MLILCALMLFIRTGFVLRLVALFKPDSIVEAVSRTQVPVSRRLFIYARIYGGLRTDFGHYRGPLPRTFMIISNHQSLADIPALAVTFPNHVLRFVAKRELGRKIPYISLALRMGKHALISRTTDFREGQRRLRELAELSLRGICPVIFPEGTRSRTGQVGSFYAGAVRIILEHTPMPVLSVAVDGGYRMSTLPKLVTAMRGTRYRVRPLTLYPAPRGKREVMQLLGQIETEITGQVGAWRRKRAAGSALSARQ